LACEFCAICLSEKKNEAQISCSHSFCFECIYLWSEVTNCCPICRREFSKITASSSSCDVVAREQVCDEMFSVEEFEVDEDVFGMDFCFDDLQDDDDDDWIPPAVSLSPVTSSSMALRSRVVEMGTSPKKRKKALKSPGSTKQLLEPSGEIGMNVSEWGPLPQTNEDKREVRETNPPNEMEIQKSPVVEKRNKRKRAVMEAANESEKKHAVQESDSCEEEPSEKADKDEREIGEKHLEADIAHPVATREVFVCPVVACGEEYFEMALLNEHLMKHVQALCGVPSQDTLPDPNPPLRNPPRKNTRKRRRTKEGPHRCTVCQVFFSTKSNLRRHERTKHRQHSG